MTKAVLGIIGGSGSTTCRAWRMCARSASRALGASRPAPLRIGEIGGTADRVPAAPRARPSALAVRHQLPRQYRRAEARGRHRPRVAVGLRSFREELPPGTFVLVDQFIDRTLSRARASSARAASPMSRWRIRSRRGLRIQLAAAAEAEGIACIAAAPMSCMEGPQFSTLRRKPRSTSSWGCSVIGMTNMPEAKLAREAEICYATVAMVTDFDCWHPDHDAVDRSRTSSRCWAPTRRRPSGWSRGWPAISRASTSLPDRLRPGAGLRADHRARGTRSRTRRQARCRWPGACSGVPALQPRLMARMIGAESQLPRTENRRCPHASNPLLLSGERGLAAWDCARLIRV